MGASKAVPILAVMAVGVVAAVAMGKKSSAAPALPQGGAAHPQFPQAPASHGTPAAPPPPPPPAGQVPPLQFPNLGPVGPMGPVGQVAAQTSWPFDVGMPADLARSVTTALAVEMNPQNLRNFAATLRPDYPIAASALEAKAAMLEAASGAAQLPPPPAQLPGGGVVSTTSNVAPSGAPDAIVVTADANGTLNVRDAPNAQGGLVAQLPNGTPVVFIGPEVNGYTPVSTPEGAVQGYVSTSYLRPVGYGGAPAPGFIQASSSSSGSWPAPGSAGTVVTRDANGVLNLRDAPNTGGGLVATFPNGTRVTVIGPVVNGFIPIEGPGGVQGYGSQDYLRPAPDAPAGYTAGAGSSYGAIPAGHKAVVQPGRGALKLRSAPSPNAPAVATVARGVAVLVDGPELSGYVPVRYSGGRAWASARYLVAAPASAVTAGAVGPMDRLHVTAVELNNVLRGGFCSSSNEPRVRDFQAEARRAGIYQGPISGYYDTVTQAALAKLVGAPAPPCFPDRGGPLNANTYYGRPAA